MINKEEFEFHKSIVDWLRSGGIELKEALAIVSYSTQMSESIPVSFVNLSSAWKVKDEEKENS